MTDEQQAGHRSPAHYLILAAGEIDIAERHMTPGQMAYLGPLRVLFRGIAEQLRAIAETRTGEDGTPDGGG